MFVDAAEDGVEDKVRRKRGGWRGVMHPFAAAGLSNTQVVESQARADTASRWILLLVL